MTKRAIYQRYPNTQCVECKKAIYRRPFQILKGRVYCSHKCARILFKKEHPCPVCSKPVLASKHSLTCSKECAKSNYTRAGRKHAIGSSSARARYSSRKFRKNFIYERGSKCEICSYDKLPVLNIHHIVERSNGGSDEAYNLIVLCRNCHGEAHTGLLNLEERKQQGSVGLPAK